MCVGSDHDKTHYLCTIFSLTALPEEAQRPQTDRFVAADALDCCSAADLLTDSDSRAIG